MKKFVADQIVIGKNNSRVTIVKEVAICKHPNCKHAKNRTCSFQIVFLHDNRLLSYCANVFRNLTSKESDTIQSLSFQEENKYMY